MVQTRHQMNVEIESTTKAFNKKPAVKKPKAKQVKSVVAKSTKKRSTHTSSKAKSNAKIVTFAEEDSVRIFGSADETDDGERLDSLMAVLENLDDVEADQTIIVDEVLADDPVAVVVSDSIAIDPAAVEFVQYAQADEALSMLQFESIQPLI